MHASGILVLATSILSVAAQTTTISSTTSLTKTVTISKCNPTNTACPLYSTSTSSTSSTFSTLSTKYPAHNTTTSAFPTAYYNSTSSVPVSSAAVSTALITSFAQASATAGSAAGSASSSAAAEPQSGAAGLVARTGVVVGALGAAIAFLA